MESKEVEWDIERRMSNEIASSFCDVLSNEPVEAKVRKSWINRLQGPLSRYAALFLPNTQTWMVASVFEMPPDNIV